MPNITAPAQLTYDGGVFRSSRIAPARLRYRSGTVVSSKDTALTSAADVPQLDRLQRFDKLIEGEGVSPRFQFIWQQSMKAIEEAFQEQSNRITDLTAILARLTAAEEKVQVADDKATQAQAAAEATQAAVSQTFTQIDPMLGDAFEGRLDP